VAGLSFDIRGDNTDFNRKMQEVQSQISETAKIASDQSSAIDQLFGRLTSAAAKLGISLSALGLGQRIMQTRGEFQQLEVAFNTMLGSAEKGNALMQQLVRTAAITPFDLKGVAQGAKQLLAYGIAAEEVNDTIVKIGDIAAGLSVPLNDLVYLYGTTMTQGRMFTQDLRQFQGRGVPLADALAKELGIAKSAVSEAVSSGKVDAETFKKALLSLAGTGSQFGGLMETQSKTITGQISNIQDALDVMFNEIGKSSEGLINTGLSGVSFLIENYEKVGKILLVAATAFGTYKASLIATQAIEKAKANNAVAGLDAEITKINEEIAARERLNGVIAQKPVQGSSSVGGTTNTDNGKQTPQEKISSLQGTLAERQAVLQAIKQEEAVEKQAKLNVAATEHNAAQAQLSIAQERQRMAQSSLAIAQQEFAVAVNEKTEAEARVLLANQEYDARERALLQAQKTGDSTKIQSAQNAFDAASLEKDNALSASRTAQTNFDTASRNVDLATEAERTAVAQAQTAALNEQTAAENMHNAAVEKANALNSLNAGETDKEVIAARKEIVEIEAKTAALEAEIQRKRELLSMPEGNSQATEISSNPEVAEAQSKLSEQEKINAALDEEFQKRVDIAQQELTSAEEKYATAEKNLAIAKDEDAKAQDNLIKLQYQKDAADAKVLSAIEYKDVLAATADYEGKEQDQYAADIELHNALCEQITADNELMAGSEEAKTAAKKLDTAEQEMNSAATQLNTAETNLNTASNRQQAASETQATVASTTNTTATTSNTVATQSNTLTQRLNAVATKAGAAAQALLTSAINTVKGAWNGLKLAMATNPFGFLITAATTLISLLPIVKDWLGLNADEASDSSEKFGEAASKTISNIRGLYAVINSADKSSSTYKQAMDELVKICEEYGIQLDKEKDLIDQVNGKRNDLIALVQKEGVERQHANNIASIEQNYQSEIEKIQKEMQEKVGSGSDSSDSLIANLITQKVQQETEKLSALKNAADDSIKQIIAESGGNIFGSAAENRSYEFQEYKAALDSIIGSIQAVAEKEGIHTKSAKDLSDAVEDQIGKIIKSNEIREKEITVAEKAHDANGKAARSLSGLSDAEWNAAEQARLAKTDIKKLGTEIETLLNNYGINTVQIKLKISQEGSIPEWMQGKSIEELQKLAAYYTTQATDMAKKHIGTRYYKNTKQTLTREDNATIALQASTLAQQKQEKADRDKNNKNKPSKSSGKSAAEIQAEADKKIAEEEKRWSETEAKNAQERAYAIEQARIDGMAEGNEKTLAQLKLDHQKELDQIKKQEDDLLKAKQEHAKKLFEAEPKNKGKDFTKTQEYANIALTDEEKSGFEAQTKSANIKYDNEVDEVRKQELDKLRQYYIEYGNLQEQFANKMAEYNDKIEAARQSGDNTEVMRLEKERDKWKDDFQFNSLQQSPDYIRAFKNLDLTSTGTLQYLLTQFQEALENQSIDTSNPEALQRYVDIIQQLEDKISERDPFKALDTSTKNLTASVSKRAEAKRKLNELEAQGKKGTTEYIEVQQDLREAEDEVIENEEKHKKALKTITEAYGELGSQIAGLGNTIGGTAGEVLSFIGNCLTFVTTSIDSMETASTAASETIARIEKASAILAIISAAIQLMQQLNEILPTAENKYNDYNEKVQEINAMRDAVNDYALAVAKANAEERQWFSGNNLRELKDYAKIGEQAITDYYEKLYEGQAIYQNKSGGGWLTNVAHYANPATWLKELGLPDWLVGPGDLGQAIWEWTAPDFQQYEKGMTAAINNLRIQTRKASKGFLGSGIGGHNEETQDLISWTKKNLGMDLFDEEGMLNTQAYEQILDKYEDKLVGETKATLEALKEYKDTYDEYIEKLEDYVSELYSPLVQNFTDALWDWFDDGKNALDSFKEYASDTFRDIVTDMMQSIMLSDFIDQFSETVKSAYKDYSSGKMSEDKLMQTVMNATELAAQTYENNLPLYQDLLSKYSGMLEQYGIYLDTSSQQSDAYGEASNITQDQASELLGRATAISWSEQQSLAVQNIISQNVASLVTLQTAGNSFLSEIRTMMFSSTNYLADIQTDTRKIYNEWTGKLDKMQKSLEKL